ncbi:MAG: hypothetical protein U0531_15740 [Dehalococcoidia bacterium]
MNSRHTLRTLARTVRATLLAVALLAPVLAPERPAIANGVPMRIPLTYLPGISNTGSPDARGEAELSFAESMIRIEARGLPAIRGEGYQVWLVKAGTNKATAVGSFPGAPDGVTGFTGRLNGLDGYDYDLVLITSEPTPDTDPAPSAKRTIGGFFAPLRKQDLGQGLTADTQPATLPDTGERPRASDAGARLALGATLFVLAGGGVLALRRLRSGT